MKLIRYIMAEAVLNDERRRKLDEQRVLDIAYGRQLTEAQLEQTQDVTPFAITGVWRIERIHDELTYWHAPELSAGR